MRADSTSFISLSTGTKVTKTPLKVKCEHPAVFSPKTFHSLFLLSPLFCNVLWQTEKQRFGGFWKKHLEKLICGFRLQGDRKTPVNVFLWSHHLTFCASCHWFCNYYTKWEFDSCCVKQWSSIFHNKWIRKPWGQICANSPALFAAIIQSPGTHRKYVILQFFDQ